MEGIQLIIFGLVAVVWLAIWIIRMFSKAFDQPAATNKKPFVPKPNTSLEEMLRQHRPKPEPEILERSEPRVARTLEVQEPRRKSLETQVPMGRSQESVLGEFTGQREDIVRRRQERTVFQKREPRPVSVFAQMLRNPEGARNAVVLAEILKRKF
ncbi:hypothetical protein I5M27_08850 [Adhaeribacter sp. BT258]|uniref:Uncharacterized protein n=1 Tax=Adhaeribacter terrigena TaxID=2793070 RepID=A0ABS1C103_9BACT|nr:hypothetical protein [Adhaeribacter terrigena]MBK0403092.1 hypothetical protein [Adhaeribacter terrigena]